MRWDVLSMLKRIEGRWPYDFPKIIENLLAISFDRARGGFDVVSRSVQCVDIEMIGGGNKYALEVKTTTGCSVSIDTKDVEGLKQKAKNDGYAPLIGAIRLGILENWVIARADHLQVGDYTPQRLALDSVPELESIAEVQFEKAVLELGDSILDPREGSPLGYLDSVLANESTS
jgi:Holliday junction resolvase